MPFDYMLRAGQQPEQFWFNNRPGTSRRPLSLGVAKIGKFSN